MTRVEFIRAMAELHKTNPFVYYKDGLRASQNLMCPLCAVCYWKTGKVYSNNYAASASQQLELSDDFGKIIISVSDRHKSWKPKLCDITQRIIHRILNIKDNYRELKTIKYVWA